MESGRTERPGYSMITSSLVYNDRPLTGKALWEYASFKTSDTDTPDWEKDIFRFILTWLDDPEEIIQHSSGTTGKPKEIILLKTSMIRSAENTCRFFSLNSLMCAGGMALTRCPLWFSSTKAES